MKTRIAVLASLLLSFASPLWAVDYHSQLLTPDQRVQQNSAKVELNPSLRGRWNPKAQEPASEKYLPGDDLPQKILVSLRDEESLKDSPILLDVKSAGRKVTLEGIVNDEAQRDLIERKAKEAGASSVENRLKIKTSDQELIQALKSE